MFILFKNVNITTRVQSVLLVQFNMLKVDDEINRANVRTNILKC